MQSTKKPIAQSHGILMLCKKHDPVSGCCTDVDALSMDNNPADLLSGQDKTKIYCNEALGCSFSNPRQLAVDEKYAYIANADVVFTHLMPEQAVVQNQVHVVVEPQPIHHATNDQIVNMHFFGVILTLLSVPVLLWLARCTLIYLS